MIRRGLAGNPGRARLTPQTYRRCEDDRVAVSIVLVEDDDPFRWRLLGV
jgi:hypothetical protein